METQLEKKLRATDKAYEKLSSAIDGITGENLYVCSPPKTIKGVTIGDYFKQGKNLVCQVVDFHELKSVTTGESKGYICIAKGVNTMAKNEFDVPFATVIRNRI